MDNAIGCLFMLVILIGILLVGGLFVTSTAVLYYEEQEQPGNPFVCHYFTGTRTLTLINMSATGCKRFIAVGDGATVPQP